MMKITVEVNSGLKEDFNHKSQGNLVLEEVVSPGTSLVGVIHLLADKYPKFGKKAFDNQKQELIDYCLVALNGSIVSAPAQLNIELKEGDTVTFLPFFFGG
jgi:molybdopterin converting factor small subunit